MQVRVFFIAHKNDNTIEVLSEGEYYDRGISLFDPSKEKIETIYSTRLVSAVFLKTKSDQLYGLGSASNGTDLSPSSIVGADKVWISKDTNPGSSKIGLAIKNDRTFVFGSSMDNRFLPKINGKDIDLVEIKGRDVFVRLKDKTGYLIDGGEMTANKYDRLVSFHSSINTLMALQAQQGKSDCETGCTLIPNESLQRAIDKVNNDLESYNDISLDGIKEIKSSGNFIFLVKVDGSISTLYDSYHSFSSSAYTYDVNASLGTSFKSLQISGHHLLGVTEDRKLVVLGESTNNGVFDASGSYSYASPTPIENVVKVVPGYSTHTVLMSDKDDCSQGCSVTSFGQFFRVENDNIMGAAKDLSDVVEVYATSRSFIAKRLNGEYVVWGNEESGGDLDCSSDIGNYCEPIATSDLTKVTNIFVNEDKGNSSGFWLLNDSKLDYVGADYGGSNKSSEGVVSNLVDLAVSSYGAIGLVSSAGNCDAGCSLINHASFDVLDVGSPLTNNIKSIEAGRYGFIANKTDGSISYIGFDFKDIGSIDIKDSDLLK